MIVWGGRDGSSVDLATGASYNPATNAWAPLEDAPAVTVFTDWRERTPVSGGTELFVWGGCHPFSCGSGRTNTGERFDPATNRVRAMNTTGAPQKRESTRGVWTGSKVIYWGGRDGGVLNSGGVYDPATDSWTATSTGANVPAAREDHDMFWDPVSGVAIVYGGYNIGWLNSGALYDPVTDTWQTMNTTGGPNARAYYSAAWSGQHMYIYGGVEAGSTVNTGFKYALSPTGGTWSPIASHQTLNHHRALWAAGAMYVMGGYTGGNGVGINSCWMEQNNLYRYDPLSDTWSTIAGMGIHSGDPNVAFNGKYIFMYGGMEYDSGTNSCVYNTRSQLYDPVAGTSPANSTYLQPPGYNFPMAAIQGEFIIPWATAWPRYLPPE
jgi:hypothetical protein